MYAFDRCSTRAANHVLEFAGVFAGFQYHLRGAEHGLRGKTRGDQLNCIDVLLAVSAFPAFLELMLDYKFDYYAGEYQATPDSIVTDLGTAAQSPSAAPTKAEAPATTETPTAVEAPTPTTAEAPTTADIQ